MHLLAILNKFNVSLLNKNITFFFLFFTFTDRISLMKFFFYYS